MEKYIVSKTPYLRLSDNGPSTQKMMNDLLISLLPIIAFVIYYHVVMPIVNGTYTLFWCLYPIITLVSGPIISTLLEMLCLFIMKKNGISSFKDLWEETKVGFGWFPGLFIVLISPVYTPYWILVIAIIVGEVVGKMLFGGFGQNIFNPALIGRVFIDFSFASELSESFAPTGIIAGATPLSNYGSLSTISYEKVVGSYGNLWNFFFGTYSGAMGETCALACLIGFIYLVVRKVIDYKIPLIYVGTVFIVTLFIGLRMGQGIWYPLFQILSGGLMFGAVFMATEPVTAPKTNLGRIMYAMMLGVLTILFRLIGSFPEGVATAILTMNIFGLIINRYCEKMRIDGKLTKKYVPGLVVFLTIFILIFVYDIIFAVK